MGLAWGLLAIGLAVLPVGLAPAAVVQPTLGPLAVSLFAAPTSGPVPLNVYFQANVSGGTGVGVQLTWSLGDGTAAGGLSLRHVYTTSGNFTAQVVATDSAGDRATATTQIRVNATATTGPDSPALSPGGGSWLPLLAVFAAGVAVGGGVLVAVGRLRSRSELDADEGGGTLVETGPAPVVGAELGATAGLEVSEPAVVPVVRRRTSEALLLHLARQGPLYDERVAEEARTQPGIAEAIGSVQNVVSPLLRRLVAAQAIRVELRHVTGRPRRVKVYALTPRGEELARELRMRRP